MNTSGSKDSTSQSSTNSQLRSNLLTFEARLQQRHTTAASTPPPIAAMSASTGIPPHDSSVKSSTNIGQCQICAKTGHKATTCYFWYSIPDAHTPVSRNSSHEWRGRRSGSSYGRGTGDWRGGRSWRGGHSAGRNFGNGGRNGAQAFVAVVDNWNPKPGSYACDENDIGQGILGHNPYSSHGSHFNFNGPVNSQNSDGSHFGLHGLNGPATLFGTHGPSQFPHGSYFGPSTLPTSAFGPDHFQRWAGQSGRASHYGLHADVGNVCQQVESWIPDSSATAHMTLDSSLVCGATPYTDSEHVIVDSRRTYPPPHAS